MEHIIPTAARIWVNRDPFNSCTIFAAGYTITPPAKAGRIFAANRLYPNILVKPDARIPIKGGTE